jgi:hypothetical protein
VVDAYMSAIDAEDKASAAADPTYGPLSATHGPPLLDQLEAALTDRRRANERTRLPQDSKSRVDIDTVVVDGLTATVTACIVDDAIVFEQTSGSVVNDDVVAVTMRVTLSEADGYWKLVGRDTLDTQEGATQCAGS